MTGYLLVLLTLLHSCFQDYCQKVLFHACGIKQIDKNYTFRIFTVLGNAQQYDLRINRKTQKLHALYPFN